VECSTVDRVCTLFAFTTQNPTAQLHEMIASLVVGDPRQAGVSPHCKPCDLIGAGTCRFVHEPQEAW